MIDFKQQTLMFLRRTNILKEEAMLNDKQLINKLENSEAYDYDYYCEAIDPILNDLYMISYVKSEDPERAKRSKKLLDTALANINRFVKNIYANKKYDMASEYLNNYVLFPKYNDMEKIILDVSSGKINLNEVKAKLGKNASKFNFNENDRYDPHKCYKLAEKMMELDRKYNLDLVDEDDYSYF